MKKYYFGILIILMSCTSQPTQVSEVTKDAKPVLTSLLGKTFYKPEWTSASKARLDSNLTVAKNNFDQDPSEENYIWLGRRLAYLYEYDSALNVFSQGIQKYPQSFRLYRHRGHRYISLRKFDEAIADLQKASELMTGSELEIEPDGIPNKLNKPLSSTQFNVWYHLGLAHYLKADFAKAEAAYLECMKVSNNDDLITATVDWLYMTYRRQNKNTEAAELLRLIKPDMDIIENDSYYSRLRMYKGELKPEQVLNVEGDSEEANLALATQGYGVGNWYLYNGDAQKAKEIFIKVTSGQHFSAFGFIAAEAELAR